MAAMIAGFVETTKQFFQEAGCKTGFVAGAALLTIILVPMIISVKNSASSNNLNSEYDADATADRSVVDDAEEDADDGDGDDESDGEEKPYLAETPDCGRMSRNVSAVCDPDSELPGGGNHTFSLAKCHNACMQDEECRYVVFNRFSKCELFSNCSHTESGYDVFIDTEFCPVLLCKIVGRCIGNIIDILKTTSYTACLHAAILKKAPFTAYNPWTDECRLLESCSHYVHDPDEEWLSGLSDCLNHGLQSGNKKTWR